MELITGFAFVVREAVEPNSPDGHRAIRTTAPSWALPGIAHQKAASHGFTFPFTPLYAMENNDDFQRPHFKIKTETTFFVFKQGHLKARGAIKGCFVSLSMWHMVNLFQGIFIISNVPGPLWAPHSPLLRCSEDLAPPKLNWTAVQSSTSKPHPLRVRQMSHGHF